MFGKSNFDRVRQLFADQFSQDANGFLYRKALKGAPIRVSEAERNNFVASFNRRLRYAVWGIVPATFGLIFLLAWLVPDADSDATTGATWVGLAAILMPYLAVYYWAWNAPSRELERRSPEGAALSKDEVRALTFSRMTYSQLGLAAVLGALVVWRMSTKTDVLHGWGMIWLLVGGLLMAVAAVQAVRKWRYSQSARH